MATDISQFGSKVNVTLDNGQCIIVDKSQLDLQVNGAGLTNMIVPTYGPLSIPLNQITVGGVAPASVSALKTALQAVFPEGGSGGAVSSVFGRTGDVTAQAGDYSSLYSSLGASGRTVTGTSAMLATSDKGTVIWFTNGSDITLTVPVGLGIDFICQVVQVGAGKIIFTANSTTITNVDSYTKTKGAGSIAGIISTPTANTLITFGQMQA